MGVYLIFYETETNQWPANIHLALQWSINHGYPNAWECRDGRMKKRTKGIRDEPNLTILAHMLEGRNDD